MTPKQIVLERCRPAYCEFSWALGIYFIRNGIGLNIGSGACEEAAWADAASRPKAAQPVEKT